MLLWVAIVDVVSRLAVVTAVDPGYVVVDGDARVARHPDTAAEDLTVGQDAPAHEALRQRQLSYNK